MPEVFTVPAASLYDPSRFRPQLVTCTVRARAWDVFDLASPYVISLNP